MTEAPTEGVSLSDRRWPASPPALASRRRGLLPPALDMAEMPDREGDRPGEDEQANDHEARGVDVEARHEVPEAAGQMEFV